MPDTIETLGRSTIHHGPANDRIYVLDLDPADVPEIVATTDRLARRRGYSKIFVKAPLSRSEPFLCAGYRIEARVPRFFDGREDGLFLGKFLDDQRGRDDRAVRTAEVIAAARARAGQWDNPPLGPPYAIASCEERDADALAELYDRVFESYPFPIGDPAFVRRTMRTHVAYFGAWCEGELVAAASAEMHHSSRSVEMTDFATRPDHRGRSLACHLLARMDEAMAELGMPTACTIARAPSFGMNITFARLGYRYAGTLVNNTHIAGGFESMNVWYKHLDELS